MLEIGKNRFKRKNVAMDIGEDRDTHDGTIPVQFTPTSASWINQVERWLPSLRDSNCRGVHT
jgi:hypothetical protein